MVNSRKYAGPENDTIFKTERDRSPNPADDRGINLCLMDEQDIKSLRESGESSFRILHHTYYMKVSDAYTQELQMAACLY